MSLYPTIFLTVAEASPEPNFMPSGTLVVIPIDMTVNQMVEISVNQMSNTQDYSMRGSLSVYPGGDPIPSSSFEGIGTFAVMKYGAYPLAVYVPGQIPPENTFPIQVSPGVYNLNILNLTNEKNIFGFALTVLA